MITLAITSEEWAAACAAMKADGRAEIAPEITTGTVTAWATTFAYEYRPESGQLSITVTKTPTLISIVTAERMLRQWITTIKPHG